MRSRGGEESEGVARGSAEEADQQSRLREAPSRSLSTVLAAVDVGVDVNVGDVPVQQGACCCHQSICELGRYANRVAVAKRCE